MKDELKAKFFQSLLGTELFTAELALEDEHYAALQKKMATMEITPNVAVDFARLRGGLEALELLKRNRERLVELARSRTTKNS